MYPVLLNIGSFPVSSFGFLLSLGIFFGGFTVWRIARGYELDAEKILDLLFLTVASGFIISRLAYVITNLSLFDSVTKVFFFNRYPGLSFWEGITGGLFALFLLSRRIKFNFFQIGDFAIVGFFLAAFFAEIGCLLGGCGAGFESQFLGVEQVGLIGKRFPVQLAEALIFLLAFLSFWKSVLRFHVEGSLLAKGLILMSIVKFAGSFLKAENPVIKGTNFELNLSILFSAVIFLTGLKLYYKVNKKTLKQDLLGFLKFFISRKTQTQVLVKVQRGWYNHWVNLRISLGKGKKKLFKLLNIKPNPENF